MQRVKQHMLSLATPRHGTRTTTNLPATKTHSEGDNSGARLSRTVSQQTTCNCLPSTCLQACAKHTKAAAQKHTHRATAQQPRARAVRADKTATLAVPALLMPILMLLLQQRRSLALKNTGQAPVLSTARQSDATPQPPTTPVDRAHHPQAHATCVARHALA